MRESGFKMTTAVVLACLAVVMMPLPASAQQQPAGKAEPGKPEPGKAGSNAVGLGSAWKAEVKETANTAGQSLEPKQIEAIGKVDAYFNGMTQFQGRFLQTSADKKQMKGKFFVVRPGKFRFNYAPPSELVIVSDGQLLSIEDHDLKTVDKYPLESTPFRLLMRKDVNLVKDARILEIQEAEDLLVLSVVDKSSDSAGKLKLFFSKQPTFELKEWVILDAQGLETRIEVGEIDKAQKIDEKMFVASTVGMPGNSSTSGN